MLHYFPADISKSRLFIVHQSIDRRFVDMNKLLKMIVLLVQIVGGLVGLGLIGRSFYKDQLTQTTQIIHGIFAFLFLFGILAALTLTIKPRAGLVLSSIFQAIQIPVITKSGITYALSSGACFNLYKQASGWGFNFFFGSHYSFYLNSVKPPLLGINIVALVLFVYLFKEIWFTSSVKKPCEFPPCRAYSTYHSSKKEPYMDTSSPLRHIIH